MRETHAGRVEGSTDGHGSGHDSEADCRFYASTNNSCSASSHRSRSEEDIKKYVGNSCLLSSRNADAASLTDDTDTANETEDQRTPL